MQQQSAALCTTNICSAHHVQTNCTNYLQQPLQQLFASEICTDQHLKLNTCSKHLQQPTAANFFNNHLQHCEETHICSTHHVQPNCSILSAETFPATLCSTICSKQHLQLNTCSNHLKRHTCTCTPTHTCTCTHMNLHFLFRFV